MRGRLWAIPIGIMAGLLLLLSQNDDPHRLGCARCHVGAPSAGSGEPFAKGISELCSDCHKQPRDASHPVGILAGMRVPADLPLDRLGRITCATCHQIHAGTLTPGPAYKYLLRRPEAGRPFCLSCHRSLGDPTAPLTHSMVAESAHEGPQYRETGDRSLPLDPESMQCLGCHDGSIAGMAESTIRGSGEWEHGSDIGITHPVGVDYLVASATNQALTPIGNLNPAIRLYSGRVGCGSCHSPFSKNHRLLVMDNRGSQLCLQCHRV